MSYNLGTAEGRIVIDGSGAERGFSVAQAAANGFTSAVSAKIDQVRSFGQHLVAVGAAGVAGFGVAVKAASGFEAELSGIQAVSGATGDQMDQISKLALQLGKDTVFSASEAAQAIQELVKAGVPLPDIMNGAAAATVNLAAAGGISLPEAASIAANAMNQFSLAGQELPHVADLIAGAANASSIDVSDFGVSLSQVGAVAHLAGLSFDDTAVAIAEMGKQGIRGSDAGTSLKTMLMNLIPTTNQQIQLMQQLGLMTFDSTKAMNALQNLGIKPLSGSFEDITNAVAQYIEKTKGYNVGTKENQTASQQFMAQMGVMNNMFFDQEGHLKSLRDIQDILAKSTANLSDEQKTSALSILFGSDAVRAASVMANGGAKAFDDLNNAMKGTTAADVAKTRMDNLKGSVEQFKGSLETAEITIGRVIIPVVRAFVDALTWLINVFNNLPQPIQTAIGVLFAIGTAFSLVMGAGTLLLLWLPKLLARMLLFKTLSTAIESIKAFWLAMQAGQGARAAILAAGEAWVSLGSRVALMGKIAVAARAVWVAMTGPVGIIIAIIAAIVAAFVYAWNHFEGFRNFVKGLWDDIVGFFKAAWQTIENIGKAIGHFFSGPFLDFFKAIPNFFRDMWNKVTGFFKDHGDLILAAVAPIIGIPMLIIKHWDEIVQFFKDLPGNIAHWLGNVAGSVARWAVDGWNGLTDGLGRAWDRAKQLTSEGFGQIRDLAQKTASIEWQTWDRIINEWLPKAWDRAKNLTSDGFSQIGDFFKKAGPQIGKDAGDTWDHINDGLPDAWGRAENLTTTGFGQIGSFFADRGSAFGHDASNMWDHITDGLSSAWDRAKKLTGEGFGQLATFFGQQAGSWTRDKWDFIHKDLPWAWDRAYQLSVEGMGQIRDFFVKAGPQIGGDAKTTWDHITDGLYDANQRANQLSHDGFKQIIDWLTGSGADSPGPQVSTGSKETWHHLSDGLPGAWADANKLTEDGWKQMGSFFATVGSQFGHDAAHTWDQITNGLKGAWDRAYQLTTEGFSQLWTWLTNLGPNLDKAGRDLIAGLVNGIVNAWNEFTGWVKGLWQKLVDGFKETFGIHSPSTVMYALAGDIIQGLWDGLVAFWNNITTWFTGLPTQIQGWFADAYNWLFPSGGFTMQGFQDGLSGMWTNVSTWFQGLPPWITGLFSPAGSWLPGSGNDTLGGFWNGASGMWNNVSGWFQGLPPWIQGLFSPAGSWLPGSGDATIGGFHAGATGRWPDVAGWFGSLGGNIKGLFADAGSWLQSAGNSIVQGLWNGISSAGSWLYGQVRSWAAGIVQAAKDALGVKSPSRVFRDEVGKYIVMGLGEGLNKHEDYAINEAVRLAQSIANAFHDAMPTLETLFTAGLQYLPGDLRSQLQADLAGLTAQLGTTITGKVPASQEVRDHAAKVINNHFDTTINNPVAEKSSDSEARRLRAVSAIGAFTR